MTTDQIQEGIKNGTIKTFDCTPTWLSLLPMLLEVYPVLYKKVRQKNCTEEVDKEYEHLRSEFKKMAIAADKWNEHCKKINKPS